MCRQEHPEEKTANQKQKNCQKNKKTDKKKRNKMKVEMHYVKSTTLEPQLPIVSPPVGSLTRIVTNQYTGDYTAPFEPQLPVVTGPASWLRTNAWTGRHEWTRATPPRLEPVVPDPVPSPSIIGSNEWTEATLPLEPQLPFEGHPSVVPHLPVVPDPSPSSLPFSLWYNGCKYTLSDGPVANRVSEFGLVNFDSLLFDDDFKGISAELFLLAAAHILLLYGVVVTTWAEKRYPILLKNISYIASVSLLMTLLLFLTNPINHGIFLYHTIILDSLTDLFKIIIIVATLFSLLVSVQYLQRQGLNYFEFLLFIILSASSMLFLLSSQDFISMYLAIELQSLAFYIMAALKRDSEFSTEAGLKYFILGAFSSGLLVFGCSLIYGFTGTVEFSELSKLFSCGWEQPLISSSSWRGCELGIIFLLIGFLFKLTAVPFHMWAPDVYEGAPTAVTAFFAITPKASLLLVFVRLLYQTFFDYMAEWQSLLIFSSLASMILGSFAGLSQQRIKRLLAYSSIGHVGYLLVAVCCGSIEGLQAVALYLVIYMIMTTTIFAVILAPLRRSLLDGVERVKYTTDFGMLGRINPLLAGALTLSMFSLAGIPPLAGFYGKAFLFWAALSSSQYFLAFVGITTSAISCFYYIRLVKIMYFETPKGWLSFLLFFKEGALILAFTLLIIICLMGYPAPLYVGSHKVALTLSL